MKELRALNDAKPNNPQPVTRRAYWPKWFGEEHVRTAALPADGGALERLLPRSGQRRREQPGCHERRIRCAPLHRRQAIGCRPVTIERTPLWNDKRDEHGPFDFLAKGKNGLLQPAVKCRGREYLRIIYGPDYTSAANLTRLRSRGLGAKRSLALREFALGIEALERFVRREPLRRVHECVFGVLALESEPVDPRL
jgi:hypothetical protein